MSEEISANKAERSRMIKMISTTSSCENDEPAAYDHNFKESSSLPLPNKENEGTKIVSKDVVSLLSNQLDRKGFCEGIVFLWAHWTSRPYIMVESFGWIFKSVLCCLRYLKL